MHVCLYKYPVYFLVTLLSFLIEKINLAVWPSVFETANKISPEFLPYTCTVQITSNLTFSHMCSQSPCECALQTRGRAYSARKWKYYTRSYAGANCMCCARVYIVSESTIRVCTRLIDHRTRARAY